MKFFSIYNCDRSGLGKLMSAGDFHFLIVQKGDMMEGHVLQIKIAHFPFHTVWPAQTGFLREDGWLICFKRDRGGKISCYLVTERALVVDKERHPFNLISFYFTFVLEMHRDDWEVNSSPFIFNFLLWKYICPIFLPIYPVAITLQNAPSLFQNLKRF